MSEEALPWPQVRGGQRQVRQGVVAAVFLGRVVNRRLDGRRFLRYVHGGLIVVGTALLSQSLRR
jgi:hypothetical protein